jgi:hypothetical protein
MLVPGACQGFGCETKQRFGVAFPWKPEWEARGRKGVATRFPTLGASNDESCSAEEFVKSSGRLGGVPMSHEGIRHDGGSAA